MAIYTSLSVVLYISLLACFNCNPLKEERCVYTTQDGFIDLSPLASDNETARFTTIDSQTNYEYLWSPCNPFNEDAVCENASEWKPEYIFVRPTCVEVCGPVHRVQVTNQLKLTNGGRGESFMVTVFSSLTPVCQYIVTIDFYVLMAQQDAILQHDASKEYTALYYIGTDPRDGDTRKTYITLICSPDVEGQFEFDREEPVRTYHLTLRSKHACMSSLQTTTSTRAVSKTTSTTTVTPTTSKTTATQTTSTTTVTPTTSKTTTTQTTSTTTVTPTTSPSPDKPTEAPGPSPRPFNLMTITILLFCILMALCVLNCMICLGLLTRPSTSGAPVSSPGHVNHAFEKKPLN